jgi:hypothetical protein
MIAVSELADMLHARANPWKALFMIRAYFDDAGTHSASEVTTCGGMVGTKEAWSAFELDWQTVIADFQGYGLTAFHAADCEVGKGDFQDFSREIREAISRRFSRIIAKHTDLRIFWSSIENAAWDEVTDGLFRERYEKPFGLCFEWCVHQASAWSTSYAGGSPVALVFSEQPDFRERMQEVFGYYVGAKLYAPLRSLTFASYRDLLPLQGADLVATEINRYWRAADLEPGKLAVRPEIVELEKGRGLHLGGVYGRDGLTNAVKKLRDSYDAAKARGEPWK